MIKGAEFMKRLVKQVTKKYPLFNYNDFDLKHRLSVIFLLTGLLLSTLAVVVTFVFGSPFWMNIPNILIALLCLLVPIFFADKLLRNTIAALIIVGCLYFPFLFFTNGGNAGSGPLYFIMIIIYFSFYLDKRKLLLVELAFVVFYSLIMVFAYLYPDTVIPYDDKLTETIDMIIAVSSISVTIAIVSYTTFLEYKKERDNAKSLLDEVHVQKNQLEQLLIVDQLTETYSRSYFMTKLKEEFEYNKEKAFLFYVLMIDIDDFKYINDTHGHLYGDKILFDIGQSIKNSVRLHDIVARYGGEEFTVLITHSNTESGQLIAERIRKNVEQLKHRYNETVTISIGLTQNKANDTVETILKRADDLLYVAKDNGKNQVQS